MYCLTSHKRKGQYISYCDIGSFNSIPGKILINHYDDWITHSLTRFRESVLSGLLHDNLYLVSILYGCLQVVLVLENSSVKRIINDIDNSW